MSRAAPSGAAATLELLVPASLAGERLDRALVTLLADRSRAEVSRWISEGAVLVDGRVVRPSATIRGGERLVVTPPPPLPSAAKPDPTVVFRVVHADAAVLVVDKPAGLVVHPSKGHWEGTLVHGLLALGELAAADPRGEDAALRPGIVHRIDRGTSGLLVVARTAVAREALKAQFAAHTIERVYDALAVGPLPDRLDLDTAYGRHPRDRLKFTGKAGDKRARTHVIVVERLLGGVARIECRLETGRTHQIRVHLSEAGAPLLGDPLYSRPPTDPRARAASEVLARQALHARVLGFDHPSTGKRVRFEAPWPEDFAAAVRALR